MRYLLLLLLSGCSALPVSTGTFQSARVEQSQIDADQSKQTAQQARDIAKVAEVVLAIVPDAQKPVASVILQGADASAAMAQSLSEKAQDREEYETQKQEQLQAAPGIGDLVGDAATGNWQGILATLAAMYGTYMTMDKLRMKSRLTRYGEKAVAVSEMTPEEARKVVENDPDLCKFRKKA